MDVIGLRGRGGATALLGLHRSILDAGGVLCTLDDDGPADAALESTGAA